MFPLMRLRNIRDGLTRSVVMLTVLGCVGCGVYTFSGSTLPGHMKTVDIPLFVNRSMQPDVAERLTEEVTRQVLSTNLLRIVSQEGDATIEGTIIEYVNHPYTYDTRSTGVSIDRYAVRIAVDVQFMDNKKSDPIYRGQIRGEGIYNFQSETEQIGRDRAIKQIAEQILQNSVQSW